MWFDWNRSSRELENLWRKRFHSIRDHTELSNVFFQTRKLSVLNRLHFTSICQFSGWHPFSYVVINNKYWRLEFRISALFSWFSIDRWIRKKKNQCHHYTWTFEETSDLEIHRKKWAHWNSLILRKLNHLRSNYLFVVREHLAYQIRYAINTSECICFWMSLKSSVDQSIIPIQLKDVKHWLLVAGLRDVQSQRNYLHKGQKMDALCWNQHLSIIISQCLPWSQAAWKVYHSHDEVWNWCFRKKLNGLKIQRCNSMHMQMKLSQNTAAQSVMILWW